MFEGKTFFPVTGIPIRKIVCMIRLFALAEPVPLTVPILNAKSFTRGVPSRPGAAEAQAVAVLTRSPSVPTDQPQRRGERDGGRGRVPVERRPRIGVGQQRCCMSIRPLPLVLGFAAGPAVRPAFPARDRPVWKRPLQCTFGSTAAAPPPLPRLPSRRRRELYEVRSVGDQQLELHHVPRGGGAALGAEAAVQADVLVLHHHPPGLGQRRG